MPKISIEPADIHGLCAALREAGLPTADLNAPGRLFYRMEGAGRPTVYGGLEIHGMHGLLRSLAVVPAERGRGHGREMALALIEEARARDLTHLWLLTLTAAEFFAKLGFQRTDRSAAPPAIAASEEFATLCPASAVCMTFALGAHK
jgi:N-acetylglutamate synthase-like GNAT family acetyltransferase